MDTIYVEEYLGFIFVLKDGVQIEKVEEKSIKATSYKKIYFTKDEIVIENTTRAYRVYYFTKYNFSKGFAEEASIKITYKDGKEDKFVVKAKNIVADQ